MRSIPTPLIEHVAVVNAVATSYIIDVSNFASVGFQWVTHDTGGDIASIEFAVTCAPPTGELLQDPAADVWVTDARYFFATLPSGAKEASLPFQFHCLTYTTIRLTVTGGTVTVPDFSLYAHGKAMP